MRHLRNVGLAVLALALTSTASLAQRRVNTGGAGFSPFWEFGVDFVALNFGLEDPSTTQFGFGAGAIRAGRHISDVLSIEPVVVFGTQSVSGGGSSSDTYIEVGVLYHLQSDRAAQQWYVRPNFIFTRSSGGGTSANRTGFGVGFGVKRPSKKNSKFTWRAEATYTNMMDPSASSLNIGGGVSIYTK
jgi:hypothetical protein